MTIPNQPQPTAADIHQRHAIASAAGRIAIYAVGGAGHAVPSGSALGTFDRLVEIAETLGASLAYLGACRAAADAGQPEPEPADNVAVGAELSGILTAVNAAVVLYDAAIGGALPSPLDLVAAA
jgi:hypothetical protein